MVCEGVADSGRVETVYNLEVEGDHTYFVGDGIWGFDVWAHNYAKRMTPKEKAARAKAYADSVNAGKPHSFDGMTPKQQRSIKEYAEQKGLIDESVARHGNSHATTAPALGYKLVDRDDKSKTLIFGETTAHSTRYSKKFLDKNNAEMIPMASGTKKEMHQWQHQQILDYKMQHGERPRLNENDY